MESLFSGFQSLLESLSSEKAEKNIAEALNYVRLDFRNLGEIIGLYQPLEVLKMASWEERRIVRTKAQDLFASASARLMPVLLQSVVQSTFFDVSKGISSNRSIKERDWNRIKQLSEDVSKRLLRCIECYTVLAVRTNKIREEDSSVYLEALFNEVFPPEEDIDRIEKLSYIAYLIMEAGGKICQEVYGSDAPSMTDGMYRISKRSIEGIDKLTEEISIYKSEMETMIAQHRAMHPEDASSEDEIRDRIVREQGWEDRVAKLAGERDAYDLYRPEFACNLPSSAYEALSAKPGTLDINAMMMKGVWPASIYPFLSFGDMYFTFIGSHLQTYSTRILQETAGLMLKYTEAAEEGCRQIFIETDDASVYSFDGNKVDMVLLSSLEEVNAFTSPELYSSHIVRREEEVKAKPLPGHKMLIVDPDSFESLHKREDGTYFTSLYFLAKSSETSNERKAFYSTIFGELEMPQPSEFETLVDTEEKSEEERDKDDDLLDDNTTDEYEYDSEDDDEKAKAIEEKEKALEEEMPPSYEDYERSEEIEKLCDKYELTSDIIKRDEENEEEIEEYEKEFDDDEYDDEEYEPSVEDDDTDDIPPEEERLYDEAEKEDAYAPEEDDSFDDPDQLDFLDELFSDEVRMEDDELSAEDEEEFQKSEDEAAAFSDSGDEHIKSRTVFAATEADEDDDPLRVKEEPSAVISEESEEVPFFEVEEPAEEGNAESAVASEVETEPEVESEAETEPESEVEPEAEVEPETEVGG